MRHLVQAWLRTMGRVGARGDVAGAGARLLARYVEEHRLYHDLTHLDDVLRHVDELAGAAANPDTVRLAAWFHDAVYDVGAADNEDRSALLAERVLSVLRVEDRVVAEVARLVRLTASHDPAPDDADGAVLCDADLAILAADGAAYPAYVAKVRAEYGRLDDATFARGRADVLRGLIAKDTLFVTAGGRAAWEAAARRNVTAELATLTVG
jgi:predicted metal-dependent HD superfamily phosphohydrolase